MRFLLLIAAFALTSCSSIPKGKSVLKDEVNDDKERISLTKEKYNGKPIYVEVQSYPQLTKEGHIIQGGEELLKIGQEEVSLKEAIDDFYKRHGKK